MPKVIACLLLFILIAHSAVISAECDPSFDELLKLPFEQLYDTDVNVASKVSTDPEKQPASVTVVSREQLQLSGARTLSEALMVYVPGYFVVEDQDDTIAAFRGLAADNNSKVMMLINGHNLNAEWFMGPPDAILNSNNFDWIERIEVIRGPGSVTLGQGALLGVVNIITRNAQKLVKTCHQSQAKLSVGGGLDNAWKGGMEYAFNDETHDAYVHVQQSDYEGQLLRREGWAANRAFLGDSGGVVADAEHRLKRSDNLTLFGHGRYKQINLDIMHVDQTRDLYNFYHDRDQLEQALTYVGLSHRVEFNPQIELDSKADATIDDYTLHSVNHNTLAGGTRETRYGVQLVLRLKELWQGNTLALGSEFHNYDLGQTNDNGDNYIINRLSADTIANLSTLKSTNTFVYPSNINVYSFFIEDNYDLNAKLSVFGGLRFDQHKHWGDNLSPRIGLFYKPWTLGQFRLSYQQGFRGAVGLNYSGGFRHDGLLRESNFSAIDAAQIPGYSNLSAIKPEKLDTLELAFQQTVNSHWRFDNVLFYNSVSNIIDVGAIRGSTLNRVLPELGSDVPGSVNNYWYFKNNTGSINQLGFEMSLNYQFNPIDIRVSHAYVDVFDVSQQNIGSMYITQTGELRATPRNVTRLNMVWQAWQQTRIGVNYLFYDDWYATTGNRADGGHLLNASLLYSPEKHVEFLLSIKNILAENNLYPMNNNVNGDLSPGTPALESTTFWLQTTVSLF